MVANLVTNAIRCHGFALIKVKDTGIGIGMKDKSRIFERFYRAGEDRSRKTGGFGLGLPIAKAISNSHGGSIEVESELDKGSTFTVRLPIYSTTHKDLSSC